MSLWLFMGLMTAAAMFAVLWPLGRRQLVSDASEATVYRQQLAEVERDRESGLIGSAEAEAARIEVSRRLLSATDTLVLASTDTASAQRYRRIAALAALVVLPVGAAIIYSQTGNPSLPGTSVAERRQTPVEARPLDALVTQVEAHLEKNPDDGRGWEVVAPVYLRLGRYDDAVKARRAALRINGATAAREADLGEALVYVASGVVTAEAKEAFQRAISLDAKEMKARYFLALALEQDGKPAEAAMMWRALLADAPPDAPWLAVVRQALARVAPEAGPDAQDITVAEGMSAEDRDQMVRGMVQRLASRLAEDGSDTQGWLRLIRAYVVLKDPEKARVAAREARKAVQDDAAALQQINALVKSLGLES